MNTRPEQPEVRKHVRNDQVPQAVRPDKNTGCNNPDVCARNECRQSIDPVSEPKDKAGCHYVDSQAGSWKGWGTQNKAKDASVIDLFSKRARYGIVDDKPDRSRCLRDIRACRFERSWGK